MKSKTMRPMMTFLALERFLATDFLTSHEAMAGVRRSLKITRDVNECSCDEPLLFAVMMVLLYQIYQRNVTATISEVVHTLKGGPQVPTPLEVYTCIWSPAFFRP